MRILSDDEYRAIQAEIRPKYRLLVKTIRMTGMRWDGALAVRADAVFTGGRNWYVRVKRTYAEIDSKLTPACLRQDFPRSARGHCSAASGSEPSARRDRQPGTGPRHEARPREQARERSADSYPRATIYRRIREYGIITSQVG
jgi:hypothetical protein